MSDFEWRIGFYSRWTAQLLGTVLEPKDPSLTFNLNGLDSGDVTLMIDDPLLAKISPLGTVAKVWRQAPGWIRDLKQPDLAGIVGPVVYTGGSSTVKISFFSPAWMLQARYLYSDAPGVVDPFAAATAGAMLRAMLDYTNVRGPTHIEALPDAGPTFATRAYPVGQQIWSALTDLCSFEIDLRPRYHHENGDLTLMELGFTSVRGVYRPDARIDYRTGRENCSDASVSISPEVGRFATFIHGEGEGGAPDYGAFAAPQVDLLGLFERNEQFQDVQTFDLVAALSDDILAQAKQIPITFSPTLSAVNPPIYGRDFEVGDLLPCAAKHGQLDFADNLRAQTATITRTDGGAENVTVTLASDYAKAVAVP